MEKKSFINRAIRAITHPRLLLEYNLGKLAPYIKNDRLYIKLKYRLFVGGKCNIDCPKTFQEKLQWIKLNDRKSIYHQMVDKYDVKKYIADCVGEMYNIPTIGIWNSFEEIDFDLLPNAFVLKGTFDSGSYYICKDKSKINKSDIKKKLYINWKKDYYVYSREWPYKGLKHRIIAEPLLEDSTCKYLRDFKFYCFNGEPKIFYITSDKGGELPIRQDFFDINGRHLDIQDEHYTNNPIQIPPLPINLKTMVKMCYRLARNTYHLRVDFYEINGKIYCGELTFFEAGGFCCFVPQKYNLILGDWIKLPIDK